jgi:hypothetical protein
MAGISLKPAGNVMASGTKPRATQHRIRIHHRIIHPLQDVAVMQQKTVSNIPELVQRLRIGDGGGLPLRLPEVITSGRWHPSSANAAADSPAA